VPQSRFRRPCRVVCDVGVTGSAVWLFGGCPLNNSSNCLIAAVECRCTTVSRSALCKALHNTDHRPAMMQGWSALRSFRAGRSQRPCKFWQRKLPHLGPIAHRLGPLRRRP
jgi:hypothetical protein